MEKEYTLMKMEDKSIKFGKMGNNYFESSLLIYI